VALHSPGENPSLQFPSVSLQLISVLVDTAKKVRSTMYIEHDSFPLLPTRFPPGIVSSHLNPFCLQCTSLSPPLPPLLTPNLIHASVSKLSNDSVSRFRDAVFCYCGFLDFDPAGTGYPLRSETLNVLYGVVRSVSKELANEINTLMIRDMSCGLLPKSLSVKVLL
jgi:hypothetical protein